VASGSHEARDDGIRAHAEALEAERKRVFSPQAMGVLEPSSHKPQRSHARLAATLGSMATNDIRDSTARRRCRRPSAPAEAARVAAHTAETAANKAAAHREAVEPASTHELCKDGCKGAKGGSWPMSSFRETRKTGM
jgi:hypothetical protein